MATQISFHLDEHVATAVAHGLRRRAVDVTTTVEEGLMSSTDEEQLAYATAAGRVMVTHDVDYLVLHAQQVSHAGICYCHQDKFSVGALLRQLLLLHDCLTPDEMLNHVEFL